MVIACCNQKGGVGKTLLSVHLAASLHERKGGKPVVAVDADVSGGLSSWLSEAAPDLQVVRLEHPDDIARRVPDLSRTSDVICDGPAGLSPTTRALMLVADLVIVPTGPGRADLEAALTACRTLQDAAQARGGPPKGLLVLNRIQSRTRLSGESLDALKSFPIPVAKHSIGSRVAFADAYGQGCTVWNLGSAARVAADELQAVVKEILHAA
jgi:chromosome partitioning protein